MSTSPWHVSAASGLVVYKNYNWDITNAATLSITPNINATLISVRDTQYK